jgi:pilus assembly protein CpaF
LIAGFTLFSHSSASFSILTSLRFGEILGGEPFDLLQLLNTGRSGTISTVHVNSARQDISRFTTCALQSDVEIPYKAIRSNIAESLNVIVQVERRSGQRLVSEVLEIRGYNAETGNYDLELSEPP